MDLAPLAPRPEYLPRPEPIPCPIRCLFCFWPLGGRKSLRFIVFTCKSHAPAWVTYSAFLFLFLYDRKQVGNLRHHTPKRGGIGPLHHSIDLVQSERFHNVLVFLRRANDTPD